MVNKDYVKDSYPAIISTEIFDKVQEVMTQRARLISKEEGIAYLFVFIFYIVFTTFISRYLK